MSFVDWIVMTMKIVAGVVVWVLVFGGLVAKAGEVGMSDRRHYWWATAVAMYLLFTVAGLIAIPAVQAHEEEKQPTGMQVHVIGGMGAVCVGPIDKLDEMEGGADVSDYPDIDCYPLPMDAVYRLVRFYEQRV